MGVLARSAAAAIIPVLVLAGCGGKSKVEPTPTPSAASPSPTPTTKAEPAIVFPNNNDLWFYDITTDVTRRLTRDDQATYERHPRFNPAKPNLVAYIANNDEYTKGTIFEIDLENDGVSQLVSVNDPVLSFDWSADGSSLAIVAGTGDTGGTEVLLFTAADKATKLLKKLPTCSACGRGGADNEEQRVSWSPDGSKLLVVNTALDNKQNVTMFVLDRQGKDVVDPRNGSQARWSDFQTIYYERYSVRTNADRGLRELDASSGREATLPIRGVFRPAVSPDGSLLAYDDNQADASVHLFDLNTRTDRRLAQSVAGPVWIGADMLVATEVRPCQADECGEGPPWFAKGSAVQLKSAGGRGRALSLASTLDADVRR